MIRIVAARLCRLALPALPVMALVCLAHGPAFAEAPDTGWPRILEASHGHHIVVYEPRVGSFKGSTLSGNAAASIQPPGDEEPTFGAVWFTANVKMDSHGKAITLRDVDVTQVKFPENTPRLEETVAAIIERELPKSDRPWPLERVYAGLQAEQKERSAGATIRNEAPDILISTKPAVLLVYQGEPQARPASGSDLSRVVNTGHFVVHDGGGKNYYFSYGPYWYQAKDPMGPWEVIGNPPSNVLALKNEDGEETDREAASRLESPPEVLVSQKPAELIVFDGAPRFEPVGSTDLLHVTNSDKDVLKEVESQRYFVLLSGRWFSSGTLRGPWSFVPSDELPEAFADIPPGSDLAHLRSSVAGTPEAEEAVLSARVPKIEAVDRDAKPAARVAYDGEPEFRRIKNTGMAYAVNTSSSVFRVEDRYYLCEDAVWYVSDSPHGPWVVSDERPEGLEELPASNPHYHTKYVYIYDSGPDVIHVGYTPGYFGCYPYWGSVVYGTGWYYHPWAGYPYYPYPATWGFGITYWGGWGFGFYGSWGWGYPSYGYPYYGHAYYGYPAYYGGYYGPGGYYPRYYPSYGTARTRTTVGDREWAGYPSTKTNAYRGSTGGTIGKSTADRSASRGLRGGETRTDRALRSDDRQALRRSTSMRYRSADEALTRRSYGTRERSTLSERGMRSLRGGYGDRVIRGGNRTLRDRASTRSRGDLYTRPRVNGRGYGEGRVLRGGGREWRDGRSGWNGGRSGGSGARSGWGSGGRAGMGGGGARSGGGRSGGSYGGARRR